MTSVASLKKDAVEEANAFANKQGKTIEVVTEKEIPAGFARFPQVELTFKLATK